MRTFRWLLVSFLVTALVTAVLWKFVGPGAFFFLFLPFAFRLGGRCEEEPAVRTCPACGFRSADPRDAFCPRDGSRLTGP